MGGVEKWVKWGNVEEGLERRNGLEGECGGKVKRRDSWSGERGGMAQEEEWVEGERGGMVKRRDDWSGERGGMVKEEEWWEWGNGLGGGGALRDSLFVFTIST